MVMKSSEIEHKVAIYMARPTFTPKIYVSLSSADVDFDFFLFLTSEMPFSAECSI